jgi:hypothetical protein
MDDFMPVSVVNPLNGELFDVYMVSTAALRLVDVVDTNAGSGRKQIYNGVDFTANARLGRGATLFGGVIVERTVRVTCDEPDNPNFLRFCDDRENGIPYRPQLKLAGTYPLPWGMQLSASLQSLAGRPLGGFSTTLFNVNKISGPGYGDTGSPVGTQWQLTRTTRYPANCKGPCTPDALVIPTLTETSITIPLVAPGTEFLPRLNQLDLSLGKGFTIGLKRLHGQIDLFNVFNASTVLSFRSVNFDTASYQQPSSVLQGRIVRIGTRMSW